LDYRILIAEKEIGPDFEALQKHKEVIETNLERYKNRPSIWSKYAWVANYHNFFCDQHNDYFDENYKINMVKHRIQPMLIIDE